ncbi:MAG: HIT domain-containing protein [Ignavibacteriae bacterium]|nr:HIT domain-containing protein [Ignavibacteriota bacterium]
MNKLFSPWRSKYIESFSEPKKDSTACILCEAHLANLDDERLIVTRANHCFVLMNLYPYNSGHLMIVPYRHTADFSELTDNESLEIMSLLKKMMNALKKISNPDGFNIGSNLGKVAGAGIDQHIHFHIVPRWNGDTNFMPVLADTKLISEDMRETLRKLRNVL